MFRKLLAAFEVVGVLAIGWVLTRIVATLAGAPPLDQMLADFIESSDIDFYPLARGGLIILTIQFACLLAVALVVSRMIDRTRLSQFGVSAGNRSLWFTLKSAILLFCISAAPMKLLLLVHHQISLGAEPEYWGLFDKPWNASFWAFMAVGSFAVIPVFEEIFYRGYAQGRLALDFGATAGVFSAFIFASSHFQYMHLDVFNIWMLASLLILALAMGYSRKLTNSVLGAILIHSLMNVPIAPDYDLIALGGLAVPILLFRKSAMTLVKGMLADFRAIPFIDIAIIGLTVGGFAFGMRNEPDLALVVIGGLLILSIALQLFLARVRNARPAADAAD